MCCTCQWRQFGTQKSLKTNSPAFIQLSPGGGVLTSDPMGLRHPHPGVGLEGFACAQLARRLLSSQPRWEKAICVNANALIDQLIHSEASRRRLEQFHTTREDDSTHTLNPNVAP